MKKKASAAVGGRIAVLGGCGFIGSHVCRALLARGAAVRIFEKGYASRELIRDIENEVDILEGDIARPDDVLAAIVGCEVVINLVHTTVPGSSMHDPAYDVESNVVSSVRWLSRLREVGRPRIVFISSGGTVYGVPQRDLIDEAHPTEPISSYGITKLTMEKYVAMYSSMAGAPYVILRPSNVYGEGQRLNIGQGVIGVLADRALRGEPLEVWGAGTSLRDYLYVSDLVAAIILLIDYDGPHRVFNVASGEGRSVLDILDVLQRQLGGLPSVSHTPARTFDVPANVLDNSRLRSETGWEPRLSLDEGVARVLDWLKRDGSTQHNPQARAD
jgi:UDP-glucose 4-epimerase